MIHPKDVVFFASPLETSQVERIRAAVGDRVEIVHMPDLHPPLRYVADHNGREDFRRDAAQEARWRAAIWMRHAGPSRGWQRARPAHGGPGDYAG
jgi:hypothetical protein